MKFNICSNACHRIAKCGFIFALLASTILLLAYSTHAAYAQASQGDTITIQIVGVAQAPGFSPALVTVHVFDYVIFVNQTVPAASITLASDDGTLSSPAIAPGKQWAITFNHPGTFEYHDTANPPHMVGAIVVVASSVALLPTPVPGLQATALAIVQAGKTPPDSLSLITPTPTALPLRMIQTAPSLSPWPNSWLLTLLLIGESGLLLSTFIGSLLLLRSYRLRLRRLSYKSTIGAGTLTEEKVAVKHGLFRRWRHKNDEDDEDDEEENYDEEI